MTTSVYYSSRDQNSRQFISKMKSVPGLVESVKMIDVQTGSVKIPPYVTSIPSVVIPKEKRVVVGSKAFEWIEAKKRTGEDGGLMCYDQGGMGGSSALCFSFLEGDGYVCSQQGFCDLSEASAKQ